MSETPISPHREPRPPRPAEDPPADPRQGGEMPFMQHLEELRQVPRDSLEALKALTTRSPENVINSGLHEYVDDVQVALLDFGAKVASTFF